MLEMLKTFEGAAVQPDELAKVARFLLEVIKTLKGQLEKQVMETGSILKKDIQNLVKGIRELEDRTTTALGTVSNTTRQFSLAETAKIVSKIQKEMDTMRGMMPEMPDLSVLEGDIKELKAKDIPTKNGIIEAVEKDIPKLGEPIRDSLELLEGTERLTIEAIKDLREELDELKKMRKLGGDTVYVGGGGGSGGKIVKAHDLSSSLNGVLKTFSLPAFYRVISVHSSSAPFTLRPTTDWTTSASDMTITFTDEISVNSVLNTGQTLLVIYAEP